MILMIGVKKMILMIGVKKMILMVGVKKMKIEDFMQKKYFNPGFCFMPLYL
jgi:hypothetical protein